MSGSPRISLSQSVDTLHLHAQQWAISYYENELCRVMEQRLQMPIMIHVSALPVYTSREAFVTCRGTCPLQCSTPEGTRDAFTRHLYLCLDNLRQNLRPSRNLPLLIESRQARTEDISRGTKSCLFSRFCRHFHVSCLLDTPALPIPYDVAAYDLAGLNGFI